MKKIIFLLLGLSTIANADRSEDLLAENHISKSYIKSFYMDCSIASPLCIERIEALKSEKRFNNIFEEALSRNIHTWPNNEILRAEEAIELRNMADNSFKQQFFGNASDGYKEAAGIIFKLLEEAELAVNELLELGEEYLFEDGKPEWAAPYFNDALLYNPENQRIIDGLARIKFLRSFEDDIKNIENLILIADYQEALVLINETMRGDPGNKTLKELKVQATKELQAVEIKNLLYDLSSENYGLSLDEKKEKLTKIENAISLYGEILLGKDIQSAQRELEDLIYTERLQELKETYVNYPDKLETTYQSAKDLSLDYPDKIEMLHFLSLLEESINKSRSGDLVNKKQKVVTKETKGKNINDMAIAPAKDLDRSKNNNPIKIDYTPASFQKASLIKSSFGKSITCSREIKNKRFMAKFIITVLPSGKAKEVTMPDEYKVESLSKKSRYALQVAKKALTKSKYNPAQQDGIEVESILEQELVIEKNICFYVKGSLQPRRYGEKSFPTSG
jgi:hypothetical protein